ncbi:unnamed protein product, partial [Polarella glacialis]
GLLKSRTLQVAFSALTRSRAGRAVLRAAAGSSDGLGLSDRRSSSRGPGEIEAGRLLQEIVGRAAAVPAPLTKQLLTLLSDACDERSRAQKLPAAGAQTLPSSAQDAGGLEVAEQDLQWVLTLLASSLTDAGEASLQEDRLLQSSLAQLLSRGPEPRTAAAAAAVQVGAEAWAAWPGNGQWFRAQVSALHGASGVEVAWLRRGVSGAGEGDEYLSSTGCDELQFTRLDTAAVQSLGPERPSPLEEGTEDDLWKKHLARAEEHARSFRDLRGVCDRLALGAARPRGAAAAAGAEPLRSSALHLVAMREESELRIEALLRAAEERANAGRDTEVQLKGSSQGFEAEIESMRQEQEALLSRVKQLQTEREELRVKLQALDEQVEVAMEACASAAERESQASSGIVTNLAKLGLHLASHSRQHDAALQHTILLDSSNAVCDAMRFAGQHSGEAKSNKQELTGAPHHYVWAALVQALVLAPTSSAEIKTALKQYADQVPAPSALESSIWVCTIARAFAKDKSRITLSVDASVSAILDSVLRGLVLAGGMSSMEFLRDPRQN